MDKSTSQATRGFRLALAGTSLLATNFITAKYAAAGFGSASFTVVWTSGCCLWALILLLCRGELGSLKMQRSDVLPVVLLGVCTGGGMICAWAGLLLMDPSFNAFLWRMMPVMGMVMGVLFLKERLSLMDVLPVALMLFGGLIGTFGRWEIVGKGVLFTVVGALLFSLQMLLGKMQNGKVSEIPLVFYRSFFALIVVTAWTLATGQQQFNVDRSYWLVAGLGSLLGPFLGFLCLFRSYRYWGMSRSSMVLSVQPLVVLPLAVLILREIPSKQELFSGAIILLGALWLGWMQMTGRDSEA